MRDPSTIDGIVVHQTATPMPINTRQVRRARADAEKMGLDPAVLAKARRLALAACHFATTRTGLSVLTRPFRSYLWHGNGFNFHSLGIEIEGLYPGIEGDLSTVRRRVRHKVTELTDITVESARDTLAWACEEAPKDDIELKYIWAHRQSSPTRRSDPGEEIWKRVVLEYAVPVLGLKVQNAERRYSKSKKSRGWGARIPHEWDPCNGLGSY